MSFGKALEVLKEGKKVARKGWNGKGMWLVLVTEWTVDAKYACAVNGLFPLKFIAMKTADDCFVPWLASQTDMLAEDWCIVE